MKYCLQLPDTWQCPVCGAPKSAYSKQEETGLWVHSHLATTTAYTLEKVAATEDCEQVDIPSQDVAPAQKVDSNLKVGTCASVGYAVADGTMTKTVPVLGVLTIKKFKKMALVTAPTGSYEGSVPFIIDIKVCLA